MTPASMTPAITLATTPAHLAAIRTLFAAYAATVPEARATIEAELPGRYAPPAGGLWLAHHADTPLGCIALRPLAHPGTAEIKRLYLHPAARGQGLARILLDTAIAHARQAGHTTILLDTLPHMHAAIALYAAAGFHPTAPYAPDPLPGLLCFAKSLQN